MTRTEKLLLLETEKCLNELLKSIKHEIDEKQKVVNQINDTLSNIKSCMRNSDAIDCRLEDLLKSREMNNGSRKNKRLTDG